LMESNTSSDMSPSCIDLVLVIRDAAAPILCRIVERSHTRW